MKKLILSALIAVVLFTGCAAVKEESEEVKLCKEAKEVIAEYEDNKLSYDETRNKLRDLVAKYCSTTEYEVCKSINSLKTHEENFQKKQDCNSGYYASSDAAHKACLSLNELADETNSKIDEAEHAKITFIGMECSETIDKNK